MSPSPRERNTAAREARAGGCWPTGAQTLLLRAALQRGPEAVGAWQRWRQTVDIERLDSPSVGLLPLLYRALEREGARDPLVVRLKGVYRHTLYANRLRLRDAAGAVTALRERGIAVLLLDGAALTLDGSGDVGLRPMDAVDMLVRPDRAEEAAGALAARGWTPRHRLTRDHLEAGHVMAFASAEAGRIDLRWRVLPDGCWPPADGTFWSHARAGNLHGVEVAVPQATELLFHALAHGVTWRPVPPLRWIADAASILGRPDAEVDWDRFADAARRHWRVLHARSALAFLATTLGLPVPGGILDALSRAEVSRLERWEYRLSCGRASRPWARLLRHWVSYRRLRRGSSAVGFARYLQIVLDCDGVGALARRALAR